MPKLTKNSKTKKDAEHEAPITPDNVEDHRQQILKKARSLVKPLGLSRQRFLSLTAAIIVGSLLIFLIVFGVLIYRFKSDSHLVYRVSQIIPYPIARINGGFVSYGDYLFELDYQKSAVKRTQTVQNGSGNNQAEYDFTTAEGQATLDRLRISALEQTKQKAVVRQLAAERGVKLSKQEVNEAVNSAVTEGGGEDKFKEAINYFYGWKVEDFRRAMQDLLLKRKLQPIFSDAQRAQAQDLLEQINGGANFTKLAKKFSEDTGSKKKGGDLGFSSRGAYVKEFEDAAYGLEPGKVSGIVETEFGFHIIKLIQKKGDQIRVAHILIRYDDIDKIIQDKLNQAKVKDYVSIKASQPTEAPKQ